MYLDIMKYTPEILLHRIEKFKDFYKSTLLHPKIRKPNFPEDISENLVKFYIGNCFQWKTMTGDIFSHSIGKIEVKCVNSSGPITFGPSEKWDQLIIVDASKFLNDEFSIYKIEINSENFNPSVSKSETYKDQVYQKRRPRLTLSKLLSQVDYTFEKISLASILTNSTVTAFPANL